MPTPCIGDCSESTPAPHAMPLVAHDSSSLSRATRRLTTVHPGDNLQTVIDNAHDGDEIVLADGTYTGTGTPVQYFGLSMLYIDKNITIRALNPGQAVLDGNNSMRVIWINNGTVSLQGLNITGGNTGQVRASPTEHTLPLLDATLACDRA